MKKYKLIKTYPGSPELGTIIGESTYIPGIGDVTLINEYPEFWQEIVERDYEILSFICNKDKGGLHYRDIIKKRPDNCFSAAGICESLYLKEDVFLKLEHWSIHSVKRLSDGEIFTIGDEINDGLNIKNIKLYTHKIDKTSNNQVWLSVDGKQGIDLRDADKIKQPLFTTEDGVDKYLGDSCYFVDKCISCVEHVDCINKLTAYETWDKKFSTKEATEEYIIMNKPCLSLSDVFNTVSWLDNSKKLLKELAKSKI